MAKPTKKIDKKVKEKLTCGIIMPISALDGCDENHWLDVREILKDSIETSDLEPNLVSDANDVGIIQKRIIQKVFKLTSVFLFSRKNLSPKFWKYLQKWKGQAKISAILK